MILYISWGYWQELFGDISTHTVQPLVTAGHRCQCVIIMFVLDYVKARGLRLVISGHSAGSHLAAMMLSSDWFMKLERKDAEVFKGVVHLSGEWV